MRFVNIQQLLTVVTTFFALSGSIVAQSPDQSFSGEWDQTKAWNIAHAVCLSWQVLPNNFSCDGVGGSTVFRLNAVLDNPFRFGEHKILVVETNCVDDENVTTLRCRSCAATLSIFEFEKNSNGWSLSHQKIFLTNAGSYGSVDSTRIVMLGPKAFALQQQITTVDNGVTNDVLRFFVHFGGYYKELLTVVTSGSNPDEAPDSDNKQFSWSGTFTFSDVATRGMYNGELVTNGTAPLPGSKKIAMYNKRVAYVFNGKGYDYKVGNNEK